MTLFCACSGLHFYLCNRFCMAHVVHFYVITRNILFFWPYPFVFLCCKGVVILHAMAPVEWNLHEELFTWFLCGHTMHHLRRPLENMRALKKWSTGWWFGTFFIFHNIWDNPSHWLIFFRGVETVKVPMAIHELGIPIRMMLWIFQHIFSFTAQLGCVDSEPWLWISVNGVNYGELMMESKVWEALVKHC